VNCFLLSYGVDIPLVSCIVLARPTRSLVLYMQSVGRGLRPAEGKSEVIVIDHGRVVENLGLPTDPFDWSLEAGSNVNDSACERIERSRASEIEKERSCPECKYLWRVSEEGNRCRNCGWQPCPLPRDRTTEEAELQELGGAVQAVSPYDEACVQFYREGIAYHVQRKPQLWRERPSKARWYAWMRTRERYRFASPKPPSNFWDMEPAEVVSAAVRGWLKAADIRFYRSQR
jgi:hypothetical protein